MGLLHLIASTFFLQVVAAWKMSNQDGICLFNNDGSLRDRYKDMLCSETLGFKVLSKFGKHWANRKSPQASTHGPQSTYENKAVPTDMGFALYEPLADSGNRGDQEAIVTPIIVTEAPVCVGFVTYLYGADVGAFALVVKYDDFDKLTTVDPQNPITTTTTDQKIIAIGDQGQQWKRTYYRVATDNQRQFQLFFTAIRGNGGQGFIGLDDIRIVKDLSKCPEQIVPKTCTETCHANANCTDVNGAMTCVCSTGYIGNGTECSVNTTGNAVDWCKSNPCHYNATCQNNVDSYNCTCNDGFQGNGTNCTPLDIDECAGNSSVCHVNAYCNNTIGSYNCTCMEGYSGNGTFCQRVGPTDFCSSNPCHADANCTNAVDTYNCTCKSGFQGNGTNCTDINECEMKPSYCHEKASCNNTMGSYNCTCMKGYWGNGTHCEDKDECRWAVTGCHEMAYCNNTMGSHNCTCMEGYWGNGTYCQDVNECKMNTSGCHEMASCTNTMGSHNCTCMKGYWGNGTYCEDIDECKRNTSDCSENAVCNNTIGSYNCTCFKGFYGNGTFCDDSNITMVSPCSATCGGVEVIRNKGVLETRACTDGCFLQSCPNISANAYYNLENDDENKLLLGLSKRWKVARYTTPSPTTGPTGDHTFPRGCGHFIYFETSLLKPGESGYFGTPPLAPANEFYCLQFYLSMYAGIHTHEMGELSVYLYEEYDKNHTHVFTQKGVTTMNEREWTKVDVNLQLRNISAMFGVIFKGFRGKGHNSDIAVDDISITEGNCAGAVNGNWGPWSEYGECQNGKRNKTRTCNSPSPSTNRSICIGKDVYFMPCSAPELRCNGQDDGCCTSNKMCNIGEGDCDYDNECAGSLVCGKNSCQWGGTDDCCIPGGEWKSWEPWHACSISCRSGRRIRFRECAGGQCRSSAGRGDMVARYKEEIDGQTCDNTTCISNGTLGEWGEWGDCSKTCNYGTATRHRTCSVIDGCDGNVTDHKPCAERLCPGVTGYGPWMDWQPCTKTCGNSTQLRKRVCSLPGMCIGMDKEIRECNSQCYTEACKVFPKGTDVYNFEEKDKSVMLGTKRRWKIAKGTPTWSTGPTGDNTFKLGCGHFIYYEASGQRPGDVGYMSTKRRIPRWDSNCLQFSLSMYSQFRITMGSLEVFLYADGMKSIFKQDGMLMQRKNEWKEITINLDVTKGKPYWIVFKATRGSGYSSDIAIDNIVIRDGHCSKSICDTVSDVVFYIHTSSYKRAAIPEERFHTSEKKKAAAPDEIYYKWSNMKDDLYDEKFFVKSLIDSFDVSENKSRAALLTTGMEKASFKDGKSNNMTWLKTKVVDINATEVGNNITMKKIFAAILQTQLQGMRPNVPRVAVLLTDTENLAVHKEVSGYMDPQRRDIKFIAVGIGSSVNTSLLDKFSGGKAIMARKFEDLRDAEFIRNAVEKVCPDVPWGRWSNYTECNVTCGGGMKYKERNCTLGYPNECEGDRIIWESCNEQPCALNGSWSEWRPWSKCNQTCRGGVMFRSRECSNPFPVADGLLCEKTDRNRAMEETQFMPCGGDKICDYDGQWGEWENSTCSNNCGDGTLFRSRRCDSPPPSGKGGCLVNVDIGGIVLPMKKLVQNETQPCVGGC